MVICGDINLPNISWDSVDSASGDNQLPFIKALHDHFLTSINHTPTRGSNILDNNNNNNLNIFMQDCCFSFRKKTAINAGPSDNKCPRTHQSDRGVVT